MAPAESLAAGVSGHRIQFSAQELDKGCCDRVVQAQTGVRNPHAAIVAQMPGS
jgi:hypothetical protein